jgi:hypothetical protein
MAKTAPQQAHMAFMTVTLELGVPLKAKTLEDALTEARALKATDIVDLSGLDHNDSSVSVQGVHISL